MTTNRVTARMVGALFLIVNITFILGSVVLVEPILSAPDYLPLTAANRPLLNAGVVLDLINDTALVAIAVLMFPLLKARFESLALGYVGFRVVEFVMITAADLSLLSLVALTRESGAAETLPTIGALLLAQRQSALLMVTFTFGMGALVFYWMLYRSRLVPRLISMWGLIGAVLVLVSFAVDLFGVSLSPAVDMAFGLPMLLNELFLGLWLIFKGFNALTAVSGAMRPVSNAV